MWSYVPPVDDILFVIDDLLDVRTDWTDMPSFESLDTDLAGWPALAMIYEGTNEIQEIDLLVRKVVADGGEKFALLLECIREEARQCCLNIELRTIGDALHLVCAGLTDATQTVIAQSKDKPEFAHNVAGDFLRAAGLCLFGSLWAKAARLATSRESMTPFYASELETAHYYFDYVMPEADYRLALIKRGSQPLPWIERSD